MLEIVFDVVVFDAAVPVETYEIQSQSIIVIRINHRKVGEEFVRIQMVPAEINHCITISIDKTVVELEYIASEIPGKVNVVFFVDTVTQFGIQIVKVRRVRVVK